jgi:malonyl-CoA O-methyltransferase
MTEQPHKRFDIDRRQLRRNRDLAASSYDGAAVLQREVCTRLLERLDLVRLNPDRVLDAGCSTGQAAASLARRYRRASISALDISTAMLSRARSRQGWLRKFRRICGNLTALPLAGNSHDLVVSSLALHWCEDLDQVFAEFARVLRPGGLLSFATFGPDTLKELRQAWSAADQHNHVNLFVDMHDVGDALVRAGFADPVLDVEHITVHYGDLPALVADLRNTGESNVTAGRSRGLTGLARHKALTAAYEAMRGPGGLPATYEVVYGHAWARAPVQRTTPAGETRVPLTSLGGRRQSR